jgi:circadian clock protein KaiB
LQISVAIWGGGISILGLDILLRDTKPWELRLYVAGDTPQSKAAFENIDNICEAYLKGRYNLEVIDLKKDPGQAIAAQIVAIPTLIRLAPEPIKKLLGDLSSVEKVIGSLGIK